jgi:hypothetical protein
MGSKVSDDELAAALAAACDAEGHDRYLAARVATMSEEERRASEANLRRWIETAQASLRRDPRRV